MVDIIERKIHFTKTNNIYDKKDYEVYNEGELLAFNEMLIDVKVMTENEFVSKYLDIVQKIEVQMDDEQFTDDREIEKLSAYSNAIVAILMCVNPQYEFPLEDQL